MDEPDFAAAERDRRIDHSFAEAMVNAKDKFRQKARMRVYYDHPDIWAREVLVDDNNPDGFYAWSKQVEIGDSVVNNSYTAVKSCHGAGKSAWAAVLVCWYVATRLAESGDPHDVFVITTAPSYPQVHLVLWEEIRKVHARGKLPGYITGSDSWKIEHNGEIVELAVGRKPADTDANSFQGKHAFNLFIVLDEANGIPETLYTGAVSMLTGDMQRQKMLAIGNPDDPNSLFGRNDAKDRAYIQKGEKPIWNTVQIKAWDTPNFTKEKEVVPKRVLQSVLQESWVEERRREWGMEDARWVSKVEADFPSLSNDSFFSRSLIDQAKDAEVDPGWKIEDRIMGVDVARFGNDKTVVALNVNGKVEILDSWGKKDTVFTVEKIHQLALSNNVYEVRVDEGNTGGSVIDYLRVKMGYKYRVVAMNSSAASPDFKRWINSRDYWYDSLRTGLIFNRIQLPSHSDLEDELAAVRYHIAKNGALKIELKDEMKKRLGGRSPDFADAVVYASADLSALLDYGDGDKPQEGQEGVIDYGLEMAMRQLAGGFSVSPV